MKKYFLYIIGISLAAAIIILFATGNNKNSRQVDERITLRKNDKIPYGTAVAYNNLKYLFPQADIYADKHEPGYWDSLSNLDSGQAYIAITGRFSADESEMLQLIKFAESGNDVFISAWYISASADRLLGCKTGSFGISFLSDDSTEDSLHILLNNPPFKNITDYKYPGRKFNTYFDEIDTATTEILGHDEAGRPNFIHLRTGKGNFYIHLEPLAFSNYFLLHKNNIGYYENALSVIPANVKKIVWDEYYLLKKYAGRKNNKDKSWISVLFRYPALKAALLTAIFTLILFVLLEMRRRQRYIPLMAKPKNDSLDFVKTIGRLYFDKGDHKNLCNKMGAYFLEYVRNRYKLATGTLDEQFVKNLQFKTGYEESEIRSIVFFIKYAEEAPGVAQDQLADFHKHLESFYRKE